jgi:hypothetical protein
MTIRKKDPKGSFMVKMNRAADDTRKFLLNHLEDVYKDGYPADFDEMRRTIVEKAHEIAVSPLENLDKRSRYVEGLLTQNSIAVHQLKECCRVQELIFFVDDILNDESGLNLWKLLDAVYEIAFLHGRFTTYKLAISDFWADSIVAQKNASGPIGRHANDKERRDKLLRAYREDCITECNNGFRGTPGRLKSKILKKEKDGKRVHSLLIQAIDNRSGNRAFIAPRCLNQIAKEILEQLNR